MEQIGTKDIDKRLYSMSLEHELETAEERDAAIEAYEREYGELEMPKLKADKFTLFDFYINGKRHPKAEEILLWIPTQDNLPDTVEEVIALYEKTH